MLNTVRRYFLCRRRTHFDATELLLLFFIFSFVPSVDSLPTQDIESFDLEDFKYNSVNITAFRLVDVESKRVTEIMDQVKKVQKHSGRDLINGSSIMQVIIFNSYYVFFVFFFFQILS